MDYKRYHTFSSVHNNGAGRGRSAPFLLVEMHLVTKPRKESWSVLALFYHRQIMSDNTYMYKIQFWCDVWYGVANSRHTVLLSLVVKTEILLFIYVGI